MRRKGQTTLELHGHTANRDETTLQTGGVQYYIYHVVIAKGTYDVVVLATHGAGRARVATGQADGGDGRALDANLGRRVLKHNAEQGQDRRARSRVSLHKPKISMLELGE